MKTATPPQKSRFSPLTIAIGVLAVGGLFAAAGYAIALATRPVPDRQPVAIVPPEKKVEPVVEKVEPKVPANKAEPVVVKKVWAFEEAYEEAKAIAERLKDEDFEQAQKNMTQTELLGIVMAYHHLAEGKYSTLHSGVNNESYSIAVRNGMANYFNKRIARWSFKDKNFRMFAEYAWFKVEVYRNPESILNSAVLYGYDLDKTEAVANTPTQGSQALNQTVKTFWENFTGARWSDLVK